MADTETKVAELLRKAHAKMDEEILRILEVYAEHTMLSIPIQGPFKPADVLERLNHLLHPHGLVADRVPDAGDERTWIRIRSRSKNPMRLL